ARSWSIPSEDPYEEAAQQLLETAPRSPEAEIPEADTPPQKRLLLTAPRPGCEVRESSAAAATRQPGPTMALLETQACRHEWQRQTADDFAVQHIMR
nr:hypothetical protein [Tanacetum cinerariifolium]